MAAAVTFDEQRGRDDDADRALVTRALAGDESAFAELYRRWSARVLRFAWVRLRDRDDAEDAVQETFLALLGCLRAYEGRSSFGTWLLGIAYHVICRIQRRRRTGSLVPLARLPEEAGRSGAGETRLDAARALERCAGALERHASPRQREIFRMAYVESRSIGEVARTTRCSPENVRAHLCRARRALLEAAPGLAEVLGRELS